MTRTSKGIALTALAAGTAAVLVIPLPGMAEAWGSGRQASSFAQLDTDEDGKLSLEEFTARAKARFDSLDADGDGLLSKEEAARLGPQARSRDGRDGMRGGRGDGWQGNMHGRYQAGPGMMYGGQGGPGMMPGMQGGRQMGPGMMPGGPMGGMGGQMQGGQPMGPGFGAFGGMQGTGPMGYGGFGDPTLTPEDRAARAEQLVEMLDADGDGKLSVEEMSSRPGPEAIFNRVDADGDGAISREEFDAAVERFGAGFGPKGKIR